MHLTLMSAHSAVVVGLFQIADGLAYLHSNESLMHGNVCPMFKECFELLALSGM